jgi:heavy metal sensor kinase
MSYWKDIGIGRQAFRDLSMRSPSVFETISIPERKHKVRILYTVVGPTLLLQLGQSMENISRFIEAFQRIFIMTMAVLIALAAVVGWFMARRAVSGVESVTRTALQITGGELKQRVPVKPRGDEIDQLATTFNSMLDRIESLVTNIKEMSDNIAHDLKSPITRIRGVAEVTLTTGKDLQEFKSMGASIIEECDRLLDMINTMLMISKTEAGIGNLSLEPIDMDKVIQDAVELFQPMAEDKQINLVCNTPEEINITGDMRLIQRMIANFIDNAIKYTEPSGTIVVSMKTNLLQQVEITVMDTGIGIATEELPLIFDRFYRCDESRSKAGVGLGLSLARTIARAHGGDVTVTSRPGKGSTFTVNLSF